MINIYSRLVCTVCNQRQNFANFKFELWKMESGKNYSGLYRIRIHNIGVTGEI
jgi:hypothetical protein